MSNEQESSYQTITIRLRRAGEFMSFDAIGIACKDIKKSIQFYELLGTQFKEFGEEHFEATTSSGVRIMPR